MKHKHSNPNVQTTIPKNCELDSLQVCGDIPENAHFVDAVTMNERTPWYELKVCMF